MIVRSDDEEIGRNYTMVRTPFVTQADVEILREGSETVAHASIFGYEWLKDRMQIRQAGMLLLFGRQTGELTLETPGRVRIAYSEIDQENGSFDLVLDMNSLPTQIEAYVDAVTD